MLPLMSLMVFIFSLAVFSSALSAQPLRLGFGSCAHQDHELGTLQLAAGYKPDLFIFMGDNVYADTKELSVMQKAYENLGSKASFLALKSSSRLLAVWDDHDYGWNDSGRHYPLKDESKRVFLDFWGEPENSERRKHKGIYHTEWVKHQGKDIQIILLDTRTFRDDLIKWPTGQKKLEQFFYDLDYLPHTSADSTLLGAEQWSWLQHQLSLKADLRIICSSTQFGITFNGYEAWANFPAEQQKMLELIKKTQANGVLFLSGDVHYAEFSKLSHSGLYPIYDFTSSGLSMNWHFATPNHNRIEGPVMDHHFGLLNLDFDKKHAEIQMELIDFRGNSRFEYSIPLSQLNFPDSYRK